MDLVHILMNDGLFVCFKTWDDTTLLLKMDFGIEKVIELSVPRMEGEILGVVHQEHPIKIHTFNKLKGNVP